MVYAPITDRTTRNDYTASASQTTFAYTFWLEDESYLDVYVNGTLKALTTDYTISATQVDGGGNVVFNSGLNANDKVAIVLNPDIERASNLSQASPNFVTGLDKELASLTSYDMYLRDQINRALTLPASSSLSSVELPTPTANKYLGWNSAGTAIENKDSTVSPTIGTGTAGHILVYASNGTDAETSSIPSNTVLVDGDIGTNVQAYSAVLDATTASFTTADETKLDGIEASADVTDETNVTSALSGATLSSATVAGTDKVLIQDADDSDNLKTVTAQSIANLASGGVSDGDKGDIVVSSSGTVWNFDSSVVTAAAKTVLDDATIADMRTTLGLVIGTDVQAQDTHLQALADVTGAGADKMVYFTSGTAMASNTITSFARTILDDADAATVRATIGAEAADATILKSADIGTTVQAYDVDTVKSDVATSFTAQQNFGEATLTDGATINWNLATQQVAKVTLGGNRTMAAPTNLVAGGTYALRVIQDATGSRTITWNAVFKWPSGTAPTLSTGANAVDILTFISDGTNMYGTFTGDFS